MFVLLVFVCHLHCAALLQIWYIFCEFILNLTHQFIRLNCIQFIRWYREREREKIYFIWLFIYICLSWILHSLVFHINNGIRFINGKKYSPIKLLFTVSNYSYMHKIHVINYLRIYKEQLFCRKIGDTCHTQYRTHAHTHRLKRMACGSLYIYTVHVFYNDGKFSPVPILWQFVYSVFFFVKEFWSRFRLLIHVLDFEYNLWI